MNLHVVGGFLGSGKTTAIINALKKLLAENKKVGVITNDKGRYMVDTAFLGIADVPTSEVPGGCFRCNYGDFQERIAQLRQDARPDVLFAESVGSCVDLVGPVLTPLSALPDSDEMRVTYSVFVDIRLLRRHLAGQPLPFSDNVSYIFANQIEEANILVVNKADLLSPEEGKTIIAQAEQRFPEKTVLLQSSLTPEGITPWLDILQTSPALPPALTLDYGPYVAGSAELAWFDERLVFTPPEGKERATVVGVIDTIVGKLHQSTSDNPIAHLKFFIQDAAQTGHKVSFTALDESNWQTSIPEYLRAPITLTINARVQMDAATLSTLVTEALHTALVGVDVQHATGAFAFAPQVPT